MVRLFDAASRGTVVVGLSWLLAVFTAPVEQTYAVYSCRNDLIIAYPNKCNVKVNMKQVILHVREFCNKCSE